jgi:DNA-binding NarL/FixJ family response regulator
MDSIRLAIIEDDTLIQESLKDYFNAQYHLDCLLITASVEDFIKVIELSKNYPEIILLDINLLGMLRIEGIPLILKELPEVSIIMLTTFEDNDSIYKALCAGACSYLSKKNLLKKY